ncbi:MAG: thiamine pyrophosphate-binding protein [Chloroflexi bacterium]|nr:thiamine pyrophosphate-binding protein [Chloroflexota bacterium]
MARAGEAVASVRMRTTRMSAQIRAAFKAEGVRVVFGLMGDGNMEFVAHYMDLTDVRYVPLRHENVAVAAGEAYARITGGVGAVSITMGPGLTHIATALMTAARGGIPIVIMTGWVDTGGQRMDQEAFVTACEATWIRFRKLSDVARAFYLARTKRTPVVLSVPLDVQERSAPEARYEPRSIPLPPLIMPNPEAVAAAVTTLLAAKRPVVLAGRGSVDAIAEVDEVSLLLGAPQGNTLPVKGELGRGPCSVGTVGGYASEYTRELFEATDAALAVGTSLGPMTTSSGELLGKAQIVTWTSTRDARARTSRSSPMPSWACARSSPRSSAEASRLVRSPPRRRTTSPPSSSATRPTSSPGCSTPVS